MALPEKTPDRQDPAEAEALKEAGGLETKAKEQEGGFNDFLVS